MEGLTRHDLNLASRKAEEAAWRRYRAAEWLEIFVGPVGLPDQPSERDFVSCLRNGQILCNVINKIQPGAVAKVVENNCDVQCLIRDNQTLTAYQYFENVRNFLMAVEELKLPAFEASDLERDNLEAGSAAKVVDCILGLKAFYEWKLSMSNGNGLYKHMRSPLVMHSATRYHSKSTAGASSDSCRRLFDMSTASEKQPQLGEVGTLEETIAKLIAGHIFEAKENMDESILTSLSNGNTGPLEVFKKLISFCLEDQVKKKIPELNGVFEDSLKGKDRSVLQSRSSPLDNIPAHESKSRRSFLGREMACNHRSTFLMQEKELLNLKTLLLKTKREFANLRIQFERDLKVLGTQVEEMSTAALGYHKVLKDNRILYNLVQDLKGTVRVYCRIRPIPNMKSNSVIDFIGEDGNLVILDPSKSQREGKKVFQFNKVFGPTANQDDVYMDTQPLVRSVMDGYNVCIFAYGQTGSGKTHTMSGPTNGEKKDRGINYLALNDLFEMSNSRKDIVDYDIRVQMVEIYNDQVRDLLAEDSTATKLEIRSGANSIDNGLSLPDATLRTVNSPADVINLMELGNINRVVSSTALNNRSSRSHSILTVHVHGKDTSGGILRGCLHLVDLAGSERVDKSEVTGERLKEAQFINKSLSCLGDVITALAQKSSHIPYRNSKLTLLLQDSLGGNAKTLMFAHVNPEVDSFGETVSTLKFAQRVSTVELGAAHMNKETSDVMQLKQQVENLKKALANKDVQRTQLSRTRDPRSPQGKTKAVTDQTPPRPQRLIIENSSSISKLEKPVNYEQRKATKSPASIRTRRLSMEGPTYAKKENMETTYDDGRSPSSKEIRVKNQGQSQERPIVSKSYGQLSCGVSAMKENLDSLETPYGFSFLSKIMKMDDQPQSYPLELMKTPEQLADDRNEVHIPTQSELSLSADPGTRSTLINSTNGKSSQIRRSLRTTIGKFINGSERRSNRNTVAARSPVQGTGIVDNAGSAVARTVRKQSLTGIPTPGADRSRRSSLGGKSTDSNANDTRNAKTPPPVHPSSKDAKKWL